MIKTLHFLDAIIQVKMACLITRTTALKRITMRKMKSSKIIKWMYVVLITTNNSWTRGIQIAWIRINNLYIHLKWLKVLRICVRLQATFLEHQEILRCTLMIWCQKYIRTRLKMDISQILPRLVIVISPIINKIICLNIVSRFFGHHMKPTT